MELFETPGEMRGVKFGEGSRVGEREGKWP